MNNEDRDKVKEIKKLLVKIEDLSKNIDLDKFKYDGGLGVKDATFIQVMRQVISTFRLKGIMKENIALNHNGKSSPYGSGYKKIDKKIKESLRDWFKKENWVRINTSGNISGDCGTMKKGKATTRCLPKKKAQSLTKKQRKATVAKKVRGSKKGKQFVKNTKKAEYKKK